MKNALILFIGFLVSSLPTAIAEAKIHTIAHTHDSLSTEIEEAEDQDFKKDGSSTASLADFRKTTSRRWKFECETKLGTDPQLPAAFREFFTATVFEAVEKVGKLNPDLPGALNWMARRGLKMKCLDEEESDANARAFSEWLRRSSIQLEATVAVLVCHLSKDATIQAACTKEKVVVSKRSLEALKATLFHEALHIMGFDSLSRATHNEGGPSEVDAVYGCTYMAWPNGLGSRHVKEENLPPKGLAYAQSKWELPVGTVAKIEQPLSTGGYIDSFSVEPALPEGLSLNVRTGAITGTPLAPVSQQVYLVTGKNLLGVTVGRITLSVVHSVPLLPVPTPSSAPSTVPEVLGVETAEKMVIFGKVRRYFVTPQSCQTCALAEPVLAKWRRNFTNAESSTNKDRIDAAKAACAKQSVAYDYSLSKEVKP